jgi:hypothetical protein
MRHSAFVKSISSHVPQFAIRPGGATYRINPDHDIIIVEITKVKLVKLLRLNFDSFFIINSIAFI